MTNKLILAMAGAAALSILSVGETRASDHQLRYAAAELTTDSGAINVYSRIQELAKEVCNDRYGRHSIVKARAVRDRCEADVIEELVSDIGDPRLDKLHAANGRRA